MDKKYFLVIIGSIAAAAAAGWFLRGRMVSQTGGGRTPAAGPKIRVLASFYPLADFAKNVGGDLVDVVNITPAGAEPHDYEPSPRDIAAAYNAQIFLYNGNGVDAWAEKIAPELAARDVVVVKMSDHLNSLKADLPDAQTGSASDPHFWLDPVNVQREAAVIADALVKTDPAHENEFRANNQRFADELAGLDQEYQAGLAQCRIREIITSHNAFRYLAARYRLETRYILGLSPDEEPSPKTIARVTQIAKDKQIQYIFFETLVNPKISETIAQEIGARTLVLNPIEGLTSEEARAGKNYISIMRENLAALRTALACQ